MIVDFEVTLTINFRGSREITQYINEVAVMDSPPNYHDKASIY